MKLIAWFQIVVGTGILMIWPVLIVAGEVPEIAAGQRDIWFHIVAEAIAGLLLLAAGWLLRRDRDVRARMVSAFALGALLYTGVNSAGYYAELGEWMPAAMLVAVGVLAAWAFGALVRVRAPGPSRASRPASEAPR